MLAAIFLFFTQTNAGHRKIRQREKQIISESMNMIRQPENVIHELEEDYSGTEDLAAYMSRSGCFPIFDNTNVTYFPIGEEKFAAMLEELKKAEKYIFIEYFIIEEGYM